MAPPVLRERALHEDPETQGGLADVGLRAPKPNPVARQGRGTTEKL